MTVCRTAWMSLIGFLISVFSPDVSPAATRQTRFSLNGSACASKFKQLQ